MEVIQIPLTDQQPPIPNVRTRTLFIVKDRLDAAALKTALDKLIREHWRKLGARMVPNPKTKLLEYHLPKTFPDNYELFRWTTRETDEPLDKAAPSLKVPPATDTVAFLPSVREFDAAVRPSDWPLDVTDDPPNSPLLYVHVALYEDASILTFSIPHVFGDQLGMANLVRAWLGVCRGEAPPPMLGYDVDPLPNEKQYADYQTHEVNIKGKLHVRRRMEYFFVILGFIPDLVFHKAEVHHVLFVPRALVRSLRERVAKELKQKHVDDPGLSDGDIITGLLTKFSHMHRKSPKTMSLAQTVNRRHLPVRGRVPKLSGPERHGFAHNALIFASSRFRLHPDTPLSEIALQNRKAIQERREPASIELSLAVIREMARRKQNMHICEPFETSFSVTNWTAAWNGIDFTGAIEDKEKDNKEEDKKTEVFVVGESGEFRAPRRFHATIMFRSDEGYWIDISFSKRTLKAIQDYLAKDPRLERI